MYCFDSIVVFYMLVIKRKLEKSWFDMISLLKENGYYWYSSWNFQLILRGEYLAQFFIPNLRYLLANNHYCNVIVLKHLDNLGFHSP